MTKTAQVLDILRDTNKTLAVAESCTGGLLGHNFTNIPGSSDVFLGGVMAYANQIKARQLNVPKDLLDTHGAVSKPVAMAMSEGIRKKFRSDYGIGITGIAGPGGGNAKKPVGLTYISVSTPEKTLCKRFIFEGTRLSVKKQAAAKAVELIARQL